MSAILGVSCLSKEALTIKTRVVSVLGKDRNHENFVSMTHESSGYIYIWISMYLKNIGHLSLSRHVFFGAPGSQDKS